MASRIREINVSVGTVNSYERDNMCVCGGGEGSDVAYIVQSATI